MKKIGFVGGISWVSTVEYYKLVNEGVNQQLGGLHFAECVIYSIDFGTLQKMGGENAYSLLLNACQSLQKSEVDAIVLCANTAHMYAEQLEKEIRLPIINIIDETANIILKNNYKNVGLLGTKYTMEMPFYKDKMENYGLKILVPSPQKTRDYIQKTIKDELGAGTVLKETKQEYLKIAEDLIQDGADCIVLGCTELPLIIKPEDLNIPVLDTLQIHASAIVKYILS
ncbi:aspartate/glutamate racemase family protein [Rhizosphaericola mali]|uniref:Amino acid racemase n=1 Tax=Rhizosphaericola mali TaxID=2545455 RepID=A0A5P2GER7_9BACT|nr:amino acid racemase [Rhizosphaericola mali]QES90101.1 amino acid racemase [Rhizosphaericola mali]